MSYSVKVVMTAPLELSMICEGIARGMDPDIGGSESFRFIYPAAPLDKYADGSPHKPLLPATHLEAEFWAVPEFATAIEHLMTNPVALQASMALDYSKRWPHLVAPTLEDCKAFCEIVTLESQAYA